MAKPIVATRPFKRDKIAAFFRTPELIKAFENLFKDVSETIPAAAGESDDEIAAAQATADAAVAAAATAQATATAASATATAASATATAAAATATAAQTTANNVAAVPFITIANDPNVANERALAIGLGLSMVDGGAGAALTLNSSDGIAVLPADVADATAALVNATGLVVALDANATYLIEALLTYQAAAATTGLAIAFTLPAGAAISGIWGATSGAVAITGSYNNASGAVGGNTANSAAATTNLPVIGRWIVTTGATAGNAQLTFRTEVAASAVTLKAGLSALIRKRLA